MSPRSRQGGTTASTSGPDQGNGEDPPAVLSGREAHELSDWGRPPVTVQGRTRGQSQRLEGEQPASEQQQNINPEVADALLAAAYEWTKSGSILKSTSWTTEDAMAMMAGRPVENKGGLSVSMPSVFPAVVEPPLQSAADVERSNYKADWHQAMNLS